MEIGREFSEIDDNTESVGLEQPERNIQEIINDILTSMIYK